MQIALSEAGALVLPDTEYVLNDGQSIIEAFGQTDGTGSRNRTGTPLRAPDFESGASTSSAIPAWASNRREALSPRSKVSSFVI